MFSISLSLAFLNFAGTLLISACSSGPSESEFAPKIGDIETSIIHSHPSYYSHLPTEEQRTIGFVVSVSVTDPDGSDDITDIYISHNNGKRSFLRSSELNSTYRRTLILSKYDDNSKDYNFGQIIAHHQEIKILHTGHHSLNVSRGRRDA